MRLRGCSTSFPPRPPHITLRNNLLDRIALDVKGGSTSLETMQGRYFLILGGWTELLTDDGFSFCGFIYVYKFYARSFVSEAIYNILVDCFLSLSFFFIYFLPLCYFRDWAWVSLVRHVCSRSPFLLGKYLLRYSFLKIYWLFWFTAPQVDECSTSDSDKTLDAASTAALLSPYHSSWVVTHDVINHPTFFLLIVFDFLL